MPSYASLEGHDLLVLVGGQLSRSLPLLESALHRARRQGAKVVLFAEKGDALAAKADLVVEQPVAEALRNVSGILQKASGQAELAGMLEAAKSPILLTAESALDAEGVNALQTLNAGFEKDAGRKISLGVIPATACGNASRVLGLTPGSSGLYADQMLSDAGKAKLKGMVLQSGLVPALETVSPALGKGLSDLKCLVLLAGFRSPLADAAHVILPTALGFEEEGVFVSGDGTRRTCARAVAPPEGVRAGRQVLSDLLTRLGSPGEAKDSDTLRKDALALLSGTQG
jgi:predicted molibdopterin-dependent oxidoreductase YjgC